MPALWFCSPGFYEYHAAYPDDRWELIRGTREGKITRIIERACDLVDRRAAAAGPVAPMIGQTAAAALPPRPAGR